MFSVFSYSLWEVTSHYGNAPRWEAAAASLREAAEVAISLRDSAAMACEKDNWHDVPAALVVVKGDDDQNEIVARWAMEDEVLHRLTGRKDWTLQR